LIDSFEQVPISVNKLTPLCDFVAYIENVKEPELTAYFDTDHPQGTEHLCWELIRGKFPSHSLQLRKEVELYVNSLLARQEVILFSKSYCTFCDRTKELLSNLSIKYIVMELDLLEPSEKTAVVQLELVKHSGTHTTPQVFFQGTFIGDYSTIREKNEKNELQLILKPNKL
jgi:glutaredoxin 3